MALSRRLPHRGRVEVTGCEGGNFAMFSDNDDPVCLSIGWTGEFLPASTRLWQVLATTAPLVLDVGAQTGYFGLLACAWPRRQPTSCASSRCRKTFHGCR